ncbi:doublecortin domain-containing protein 2C isoform X2 [Zootoca vivipara]|uniref:doublecortin domain-containing protein 2C isoform X2 n=1 Tax=Zootoca vivipara TaxID=8524 RepID=UPI001590CBE1|nr:doublecortin domain-containing protein 2C isoform X2 [Zootoca vivipara]
MVGATRTRAVYSLTDVTPARTIWVYRNGDPFYLGRKFVINHRYVPNFEAFMIQLNEGVETPFGVRNIYTPRQGHSVMDLTDIEQGGRYVVAGRERFRKLNYFGIGTKKPQRKKRDEVIRPVVHSNIKVPSKWQSSYNKPLNISVFTNGDMLIPPVKILLPKFTLKSWNGVLGLINEKVSSRSGGIHRLFTLNGQSVHGSDELEHNHFYVACGKEKFQPLPYWQHSRVQEDIRRYYSNTPRPLEMPPSKKPPSTERSKRAAGMQPATPPSKRGAGDRSSVYYAQPKKDAGSIKLVHPHKKLKRLSKYKKITMCKWKYLLTRLLLRLSMMKTFMQIGIQKKRLKNIIKTWNLRKRKKRAFSKNSLDSSTNQRRKIQTKKQTKIRENQIQRNRLTKRKMNILMHMITTEGAILNTLPSVTKDFNVGAHETSCLSLELPKLVY